ncbi:hypothetical protein CR513_06411, partial [Mucuna pruriens]
MALACFLSRSVEKAILVFQCMRKIDRFRWTNDCEIAFQELKTMLESPLILANRLKSHQVIVRTNLPVKQILRKPDLVGRMVGWAVELSEFDIVFEKRGHIKA